MAVLSYGFWNHRFGRNPAVVGSQVTINGRSATIVGVMPPEFSLPSNDVDLWMPMGLAPEVLADRASEWVSVIGRLRPGVSMAAAQTGLSATAALLGERSDTAADVGRPDCERPTQRDCSQLRQQLRAAPTPRSSCSSPDARTPPICCSRGRPRAAMMALRAALGAEPDAWCVSCSSRAWCWRAPAASPASPRPRRSCAFVVLGADRLPRVEHAQLNPAAVAVSIVASLATAVLFGGGAAWLLARAPVSRADRMRSTAPHRLGGFLLAGQIAFALVLAAAALIVGRAYAATSRIDPGFDVSNTVTMQLTLPKARYPDSAAHARFVAQALAQIAAVPGVASAGVVSDLPFVGNQLNFVVSTDGDAADRPRESRLTVRPADPASSERCEFHWSTADISRRPIDRAIGRSRS